MVQLIFLSAWILQIISIIGKEDYNNLWSKKIVRETIWKTKNEWDKNGMVWLEVYIFIHW